MSVIINDNKLEAGIRILAENQRIPTKKKPMILAILRVAVARYEKSGNPDGWKHAK